VTQQVRARIFISAEVQFEETFLVVPMMEHIIFSWGMISNFRLFDVYHAQPELRAATPGALTTNAISLQHQILPVKLFSPSLSMPPASAVVLATEQASFRPILTLGSPAKSMGTPLTLTDNSFEFVKKGVLHVKVAALSQAVTTGLGTVPSSTTLNSVVDETLSHSPSSNFEALVATNDVDLIPSVPLAITDDSSQEAMQLVTNIADRHTLLFEESLPADGAHVPPFTIELLPNSAPLSTRYRRMSPPVAAKVEREVQALLQAGIIEPTHTAFVSPTILVPKAGTSDLRLCIDYKQLNSVTKDFLFPLADPRTLVESLAGHCYFATLDLRQGFHQILMDPDSAHLTAFMTSSGTYKYRRLPFGVKNGPRYFQYVMTQVLRPLLGSACLVFIDDVVVFGKTLESFSANLEEVFTTLQNANFRLKRSKCVLLACSGNSIVSHLLLSFDLTASKTVDLFNRQRPLALRLP
jgi:hypothetical protein